MAYDMNDVIKERSIQLKLARKKLNDENYDLDEILKEVSEEVNNVDVELLKDRAVFKPKEGNFDANFIEETTNSISDSLKKHMDPACIPLAYRCVCTGSNLTIIKR